MNYRIEQPINFTTCRQEFGGRYVKDGYGVTISQALVLQIGHVELCGQRILVAQTIPFFDIRGYAGPELRLGDFMEEVLKEQDTDQGPVQYGALRSTAGPVYMGIGAEFRPSDREYIAMISTALSRYKSMCDGDGQSMVDLQSVRIRRPGGTLELLTNPNNLPERVGWSFGSRSFAQWFRAPESGTVVYNKKSGTLHMGNKTIPVRPGLVPVPEFVDGRAQVEKGALLLQITRGSIEHVWPEMARALMEMLRGVETQETMCPSCKVPLAIGKDTCDRCGSVGLVLTKTWVEQHRFIRPECVDPYPLYPLRQLLRRTEVSGADKLRVAVAEGRRAGKVLL